MELRNGILNVGGISLETGLISENESVKGHLIDALEEATIVARAVHAKLWSRKETRELLRDTYRNLRNEGNLFAHLLWDLSLRADNLAPHWWRNLEVLKHDLTPADDDEEEIPWDDDQAAEPPDKEEIAEKISGLLVEPRHAVPFASISNHITSRQEEGVWVEQYPRLLGTYVDSHDKRLIIGLSYQETSEFAWWESSYGSLDEDELEVLCEFLSLMINISRHWGPLPFLPQEEIDAMALIALRDLARRWHEGPVGALAEDYLREGPSWEAAMRAARIPHIT